MVSCRTGKMKLLYEFLSRKAEFVRGVRHVEMPKVYLCIDATRHHQLLCNRIIRGFEKVSGNSVLD